jgi:hypothetical protein
MEVCWQQKLIQQVLLVLHHKPEHQHLFQGQEQLVHLLLL